MAHHGVTVSEMNVLLNANSHFAEDIGSPEKLVLTPVARRVHCDLLWNQKQMNY